MSELLAAAHAVQRRYDEAFDQAVAKERRDLRSAIENHSSMPNNYWHERHAMARKVQAINAIVEVLEEARYG
jgi:hypothetical protein